MAVIDHLVYAVPELAEGIDWIERSTGIRPAIGGSHVGLGTHNALVSLGSSYLELIAPDPSQSEPAVPRPFGIDDLDGAALITFAIRPDGDDRPDSTEVGNIDALAAQAIVGGYNPGPIADMSRATPNGDLLEWRLTFPRLSSSGLGTVPFIIDWGDTPQPNTTAPTGIDLVSLTIEHPGTDRLRTAYSALGLQGVDVVDSDRPNIRAEISGPTGTLILQGS